LVTDLGRGFVLYPVAHMVEFETSHETGKANSKLVYGQRVELSESIRLTHHVKARLSDLRASKRGGQREVRFDRSVVVEAAVKSRTLELGNVMLDVIRFRPGR
jgi:hypothetical protein